MSLRPTIRVPTSPVNRYNVLNNAGKTINLFREYASYPSTHIRWIAGHGLQIPQPARVPPNTFIVFMGSPGQFITTNTLPPTSRAYKSIRYLRDVFSGQVQNIVPTRLGYWKRHVYGPGDTFPDLQIDMWDYKIETIPFSDGPVQIRTDLPRSPFDRICGVKDMNTGVKILYKKRRTVSQIVNARGPGIYIVMACRASTERISRGTARRNFNIFGGGSLIPRVRNTGVNVHVQAHENTQARVATRKRTRSVNRSPKRPSPPRRNWQGNTVMRN
jgi:hypothetical protein